MFQNIKYWATIADQNPILAQLSGIAQGIVTVDFIMNDWHGLLKASSVDLYTYRHDQHVQYKNNKYLNREISYEV